MICDCGARMQWRCTDTKTKIAKYKCPHCGFVATGVDTWKPVETEKRNYNYYYLNKGRYIVRKKRNKKYIYIGTYGNEETAREVVKKMFECDWDKSMVPQVHNELGLVCVDRVWVMA